MLPGMIRRSGLLCAALILGCASSSLTIVHVPLVDVRAEPRTAAQAGVHDPLEETQLLYGERVRRRATKNGWARIEAVEEPEFTHATRWQGYPGWVPEQALGPRDSLDAPTAVVTEKWASAWVDAHLTEPSSVRLPLGARLRATDMGGQRWNVELGDDLTVWMKPASARSLAELKTLNAAQRRRLIVRNAALFLGDPYYWGGRSPYDPTATDHVTGVDCSGLINLSYRAAGTDIPRDAHEQFLRAKPVAILQPADLIFLSAPGDPSRIVHVMLYAGDGAVIEAPATGLRVRRISLTERFGRAAEAVRPGTVIEGQTVSFGAYLP